MLSDELAEIEVFAARGLTNAAIAKGLGLRTLDVDGTLAESSKRDAIDRYRRQCMRRALADPYPDEAAEYLYVRGVPKRMIADAGLTLHRHEFGEVAVEKKVGYQARQLELARARLQAVRS